MKIRNKYLVILALAVWVIFVAWGWTALSRYENTPAQGQAAAQQWPSATHLQRTAGLPTLVVFLHPNCPCSRATVAQLSKIMTYSKDKVRAQVVFIRLPEFSEEEIHTDLFTGVRRIPGVEVLTDEGGAEAKTFQATVSGQTMLYDQAGQLVFNGGITSARGHEGDNAGQDAIIAFLTKGVITLRQTPYFGCFLFNDHTPKLKV